MYFVKELSSFINTIPTRFWWKLIMFGTFLLVLLHKNDTIFFNVYPKPYIHIKIASVQKYFGYSKSEIWRATNTNQNHNYDEELVFD